jgi:gas vesicle protein
VQIQDLAERLTAQLDDFRDRTAEAVRADSDSVFREVTSLTKRIDAAQDSVVDRINRLDREHSARWDAFESATRRTTWPRRVWWVTVGIAAGMAIAYLADPDRGRSRRAQYKDQLTARVRNVANEAVGQVKTTADRAKGTVIETAKQAMTDEVPADPMVLTQRIKSDVLGHRDDVEDVVIRVDAPGEVALKGTVPTPTSERELIDSVRDVKGVIEVRSELSVRTR